MTETATDQGQRGGKPLVTVTVNGHPVELEGPKATGLQIKEAAIAQGVPIELDFLLKLIKPNGDRQIVGDDDTVTINKNSVFRANAGDDNS
jgi:hypothetical protein